MKMLISLFLLTFSGFGFAGFGGPDSYGYNWVDSNSVGVGAPDFEWIDITASGSEKLGYGDTDPGVVFDLFGPRVQLYAGDSHDVMVSKNGYISFNAADTGGDPTNDCPFPAAPNVDSAKRICVLHDNLDFAPPLGFAESFRGRILYQYFPVSPHPHHTCGVQVITWQNMVHMGGSTRFSFQALLFDNFDILLQYGAGNPETGSGSTTGIQQSGTVGLKVACDFAGGIPDDYAVLIEPPTFTVTSLGDTNIPGTLRWASLQPVAGKKIVFDPALNGEAMTVGTALGPLGLDAWGARSIDASNLPDSITLTGAGIATTYWAHARTHFSNVNFVAGAASSGLATTTHGGVALNRLDPMSDPLVHGSFSNCVFSANTDTALKIETGNSAFLSGCDFTINNAGSADAKGGAIRADHGALWAWDCGFLLNSAKDEGGAIWGDSMSNCYLWRCSFDENTSVEGGALHLKDTLNGTYSCTFADNLATNGGGAIYSDETVHDVRSSTFSGNDASSGSVVQTVGPTFGRSFSRCTFADNGDVAFLTTADSALLFNHSIFSGAPTGFPYVSGGGASGGNNMIDRSSLVLIDPDDIVVADAGLAPLGFYGGPTRTRALLADSPAIDADEPVSAVTPDEDQRGFPRVVGMTSDIGACEYQGGIVVTTAADQSDVPAGAEISLREALRDIGPGGEITFDPALSGATISLGSTLLIDRDLSIDASGLADGVTLDGNDMVQVMFIDGPVGVSISVALNGLDIINGSAFLSGGGIQVKVATLSMIDCEVRNCHAGYGGGGINLHYSDAELRDCVLSGNSAELSGGGLGSISGDLMIADSVFRNNTAVDNGGGISCISYSTPTGSLVMRRCTFSGNAAEGNGGAILYDKAVGEISNCTISGNSCGGSGGAIYILGTSDIVHCTIANNRAGSLSGGVMGSGFDHAQIGHCIFAGNEIANIRSFEQESEPVSLGYNLLDDNSWTNQTTTDMEERVAYLAPLADNGGDVQTHATLAISPAINAGNPTISDAPSKDARGFARIAEGRIDIGAHEAMAPVRVATLIDDLDGVAPRSLRDALLDVTEGGRILFTQALDGGTIDLSTAAGGQGSRLSIERKVQIDATRLSSGITVSGGDETGVFDLLSNRTASLHAVSIIDGFGGTSQDGGGVRVGNGAELLLTNASLNGNRARNGGAIHAKGGASVQLQNVTVSDNTAQVEGGALAFAGAATSVLLEHCTVTDNNSTGGGTGGVKLTEAKGSFYSSIIANNPGGSVSLDGGNTFTSLGYNINDDGGAFIAAQFVATGDLNNTAPSLAALADNGGWGMSHGYSGSPALNAGDPDALTLSPIDGRGFLRAVNRMDIGAYENNGASRDSDGDDMPDYWEQLWGFDLDDAGDAAGDADGDGDSNLVEFTAGTNPLLSEGGVVPLPEIIQLGIVGGVFWIEFVSVPGVRYEVYSSSDLETWSGTPYSVTGALDSDRTTWIVGSGSSTAFYRLGIAAEE